MRIDVGTDFATLTVGKRSGGTHMALRFDPDTIQNWYPYSNGYTYRIDVDNQIRLFPETGVVTTPKEITGLHYLNTMIWYNKYIREDNLRVAEFAQAMGVHSPFTPYANVDVSRGLSIVGKTIDRMSKDYALKYAKATGRKFSRNMESMSLRDLQEQENNLYARVGEVYSMLNTMRKVVTVHGFGRPVEPPIWDTNPNRA